MYSNKLPTNEKLIFVVTTTMKCSITASNVIQFHLSQRKKNRTE